jgi:competence protein ComEC
MKKFFGFCIAAALLLVYAASGWAGDQSELSATFFDVGKGDCILLRQGGHAMMIDTGFEDTEPSVAASLDRLGVKHLDCLLLTHYDKDHVGGAAGLLEKLDVKRVCGPDYIAHGEAYNEFLAALEERDLRLETVRKQTEFRLGGLDVVFYPPLLHEGMVPNDYSVICSVKFGERRLLFLGDATELRMGDFLPFAGGRCDLVKLPHHGIRLSKSVNFRRLLTLTKPQYCVATNSVQFPLSPGSKLVLEIFRVRAFETQNGPVNLLCDGKGLRLTQQSAR